MSLQSWSLTFTGFEAVPEPGESMLAAGAVLAGFVLWRRSRK
jgi:MYXO-CTERM domain-containing protein